MNMVVYGDQSYNNTEQGFRQIYQMLIEINIHIQCTAHSH